MCGVCGPPIVLPVDGVPGPIRGTLPEDDDDIDEVVDEIEGGVPIDEPTRLRLVLLLLPPLGGVLLLLLLLVLHVFIISGAVLLLLLSAAKPGGPICCSCWLSDFSIAAKGSKKLRSSIGANESGPPAPPAAPP